MIKSALSDADNIRQGKGSNHTKPLPCIIAGSGTKIKEENHA